VRPASVGIHDLSVGLVVGSFIALAVPNPKVCFQVDQRENVANWRSVIAWGVFEELQGKAALDALQLLVARLIPFVTSETLGLPDDLSLAASKPVADAPKDVIYRIRFVARSGRFEKR